MKDLGPTRPFPCARLTWRGKWIVWSARLARAWQRWLRFTTGLFVSLLFAFAAYAQDAGGQERVRFLDGKAELCEVVSADPQGITLRLEGIPRPIKFAWWQIDPEDAAALRRRHLGQAPTPAPAFDLTVAGARVRTRQGEVYEGVVLPGSPAGETWIKNVEGKFVVPLDAIATREETQLELRRVFAGDELLDLLIGRMRPSSPDDYDRLGAELLRARLQERALAAFRTAELLRHPDWPEARAHREFARLRDRIADLALRRSVAQAQESTLAGDYDAALREIDGLEKALGAEVAAEVREELGRLRAQIQALRGRARDEGIVEEWRRTTESLLKARAMDRSIAFAAARDDVEKRMNGEVQEHVRRRFNFSPDDPAVKAVWDRRPSDAILKHSYGEASWFPLRPEARVPQDWWAAADDAARYKLLKGLFIEKHLTVLRAESKSCGACGGTGLVGGGVCPTCLGLKAHRVLIYR